MVMPPVLATPLPSSVEPVFKVIDFIAITVPLKTEVVPKVTELLTRLKIFDSKAPPVRKTFRPDVVVRNRRSE